MARRRITARHRANTIKSYGFEYPRRPFKWYLLVGALLVGAVLIFGVTVYGIAWLFEGMVWAMDGIVSGLEYLGPVGVFAYAIFNALFMTVGLGLVVGGFYFQVFKRSVPARMALTRISVVLGVGAALGLGVSLIFPPSVKPFMIAHVAMDQSLLQMFVLLGLMSFAVALYIFKKKAQALFGVSEIIVSVSANAAILTNFKFTAGLQEQHGPLNWIAISVFTYTLTRGIANVAEGAEKLRGSSRLMDHLTRLFELYSSRLFDPSWRPGQTGE